VFHVEHSLKLPDNPPGLEVRPMDKTPTLGVEGEIVPRGTIVGSPFCRKRPHLVRLRIPRWLSTAGTGLRSTWNISVLERG
jgi:hypothetical protein